MAGDERFVNCGAVLRCFILEKAIGTAKYANHAKTERIGEKDGFTQRENALFDSTPFLSRISRGSRFELPFLGSMPPDGTKTVENAGARWPVWRVLNLNPAV